MQQKLLLILFFAFIQKTVYLAENNKEITSDYIKRLEQAANIKNNYEENIIVSKTTKITRPLILATSVAIIYKMLFEKNKSKENKNNENKNILQITMDKILEAIPDKIASSDFADFFKSIYNSLIFSKQTSFNLNDPVLNDLCEKELKKIYYIAEQAENTIFLETFLLAISLNKKISKIKKGFNTAYNVILKNSIKTALPILLLISTFVVTSWKLNKWTKDIVKNQVAKINFLNDDRLIRATSTTIGSIAIDTAFISPLCSYTFLYSIELGRKMLENTSSPIKKGRLVNTFSKFLSKDINSEEYEEYKEIFDGTLESIKSTETLIKIIKNILKLI